MSTAESGAPFWRVRVADGISGWSSARAEPSGARWPASTRPRRNGSAKPGRRSALTYGPCSPAARRGFPWLSYARQTPEPATNADLSKIWQLDPNVGGRSTTRISCNLGEQTLPAMDPGARNARVAWIDATTGQSDLVIRDKTVTNC